MGSLQFLILVFLVNIQYSGKGSNSYLSPDPPYGGHIVAKDTIFLQITIILSCFVHYLTYFSAEISIIEK